MLKDKENTYSRKKKTKLSLYWLFSCYHVYFVLVGRLNEKKNLLCPSVRQEEYFSEIKETGKSVLHFISKSMRGIKDLLNPSRIGKSCFKSVS